jgi:hypothetical protein
MPPRSVYKLRPTAVQQQREKLSKPYNPRNQQGKLREPVKNRVEKVFERLERPVVASKYRQAATKRPPKYKTYTQPKVGK